MDQKIPPEILNRQEPALVGQAEMHITLPYDGPRISFNGVFANLGHRLTPITTMLSTANSAVWSKMLASPNAEGGSEKQENHPRAKDDKLF
jgi:hypothetical protein